MISVNNFRETSFLVHYPLIYLDGESKESSGIIVCFNEATSTYTKWPVIREEFKVFCFLKEGFNKILLQDGSNETSLQINFQRNPTKRFILPVYVICDETDGSFLSPDGSNNSLEVALKKIRFNCRLMQTYLAESLYEHDFQRKTFCLLEGDDQEPIVKVFYSKLKLEETYDMTPDDLYHYFQAELSSNFPEDQNRKYLCFMSCTRYHPPNVDEFDENKIMSYVKGHAALGGTNLAIFGTGSLHTWANGLDDLYERFLDQTMIDPTKYFDDSCGRRTYGANYSTTLGATIHELGHCFDLAHTPYGIMARGHDDMDYFFTVKEASNGGKKSGNKQDGKYKGAHWYRSSAVILNYHKWLNPFENDDMKKVLPVITYHPDVHGPVGNSGQSYQKHQMKFSSKSWLDEHNLKLTGLVFYHNEYLCGIQFIGGKYIYQNDIMVCSGEEVSSEIYGSCASAKKTVFHLDYPREKVETVNIRAGAWIDAIQIMTNEKSSAWLGGRGGDEFTFKLNDRSIEAWIGTAGNYVGSLALKMKSNSKEILNSHTIGFESVNPIRLIEFHNRSGEVQRFHEFTDDSPVRHVDIPVDNQFLRNEECVNGMVFDDRGVKRCFSIHKFAFDLIKGN